MRIVGIVGDTRRGGPARGLTPEMYCAFAQFPTAGAAIIVRARSGDPLRLAQPISDRLAAIDRDTATTTIRRVADAVDATIGTRRLVFVLLAVFAVLAATLTATGIGGVVAYVVAQRRQEIGVRMALGAETSAVVGLMIRSALLPVVMGMVLGALLMVPLANVLRSFLFGVTPSDPWAFLAACAALLLTALLAAYLPARRASRIDPLIALRG